MSDDNVLYPFVPKSTARLISGQFWAIPLSNGKYACGRVLKVHSDNRHTFFAGLMNWIGNEPPQSEDLAGRKTIAQGNAHIKAIIENGGQITGYRDLTSDNIEIEEKPIGGWGYKVISRLAEHHFVQK